MSKLEDLEPRGQNLEHESIGIEQKALSPVQHKQNSIEGTRAVFKRYGAAGDIPTQRSSTSVCLFSEHLVFLYGGASEKEDLNDAFVLDLIDLKWKKIAITSLTVSQVGASAQLLCRGRNTSRPLIFIFGGWKGDKYSNEGTLIDPIQKAALISSNDASLDWLQRTNVLDTETKGGSAEFGKSDGRLGWLRSTAGKGSIDEKAGSKSTTNALKQTFDFKKSREAEEFKSGMDLRPRPAWRTANQGDKTRSYDVADLKAEYGTDGNDRLPYPRRDHTLTLDPVTNRVYLFGGWNSFYWTYDETKFMEVWYMDSNWHWHHEEVTGEQPVPRRGHTTTNIPSSRVMIMFGGCYGYNSLLNDVIKYDIEKKTFEQLPKGETFHPEPRAWHSESLIGNKIYYFGGMKANYEFSNEVITLDTRTWEWEKVHIDSPIEDIPSPRCAHGCVLFKSSIIVFGGMGMTKMDVSFNGFDFQSDKPERKNSDVKSLHAASYQSLEAKKYNLEDIYILDTDPSGEIFVNTLNEIKEKESLRIKEPEALQMALSKKSLPPLPAYLKTGKDLQEEQMNFLEWNPHIFPSPVNQTKIKYLSEKMRTNDGNKRFAEFDSIGDEEAEFTTSSLSKF